MSLEFLVTALIVVMIPGTGVIYTVATGISAGRRASIAAAFGCTLGILPAMLASVLGLAAVFHASALAFQALKFVGAAYLIYLAWMTLADSGPLRIDRKQDKPAGLMKTARTGFLINMLNPKLSVFFLAFLPQFIPAGLDAPMTRMFALGLVFMAMTFAVFIVYGVFAASLGERLFRSETAMRWMRRTVAATFAAFGLRLAFARS